MIEIVRGDITTLDVDAVVNAANARLRRGGGVDGAIHAKAGPELARALLAFPGCEPGKCVLTPGFGLPARWILHAVGPVWNGGEEGEDAVLGSAYRSVLRVARGHGRIRTIAFPAISTGIYGFPKDRAARIALDAMLEHEDAFEKIVACLFDAESVKLYRDTLALLREGCA